MLRSKAGTKKTKSRRPNLTIARAYSPPGSLRQKSVDELPNWSTPIINPLSTGRGGGAILINIIHMVIFYKKWKKYNEIQLTKNKLDLNNRIMLYYTMKLTKHMLINLFVDCEDKFVLKLVTVPYNRLKCYNVKCFKKNIFHCHLFQIPV